MNAHVNSYSYIYDTNNITLVVIIALIASSKSGLHGHGAGPSDEQSSPSVHVARGHVMDGASDTSWHLLPAVIQELLRLF